MIVFFPIFILFAADNRHLLEDEMLYFTSFHIAIKILKQVAAEFPEKWEIFFFSVRIIKKYADCRELTLMTSASHSLWSNRIVWLSKYLQASEPYISRCQPYNMCPSYYFTRPIWFGSACSRPQWFISAMTSVPTVSAAATRSKIVLASSWAMGLGCASTCFVISDELKIWIQENPLKPSCTKPLFCEVIVVWNFIYVRRALPTPTRTASVFFLQSVENLSPVWMDWINRLWSKSLGLTIDSLFLRVIVFIEGDKSRLSTLHGRHLASG